MAIPRLFDRVKETSVSTGTGNLALDGAAVKYLAISDRYADEAFFFYTVEHASLDEWEVGYGSYEATGNELVRVEVIASSNADALVNFTAGGVTIFITAPGSQINVVPGTFQARLTLETGVPVSSTDQTAK